MSDQPTAVIADDDADIRQLVVIAARKAGVQVVAEVDNGLDAWSAVSAGGIDIAILDISMPGMDGLRVADLIHADPMLAGTLVLMVSASVQLVSGEAAIEASVDRRSDRFILKPFSPRELSETISGMLNQERV